MRSKSVFLLVLVGFLFSRSLALCEEIFDLRVFDADVEIMGTPGYYVRGEVVSAGDVNGDGIDDIVMVEEGAAYIIYGATALGGFFDLSTGCADVVIGELFLLCPAYPSPHACSGEIDGDGIDDLLVQSNQFTTVVYGDTSLPAAGTTIQQTWSLCGEASVGSGDFNGDGFEDIMIARGRTWPPDDEGGVEVFVKLGQDSLPGLIDFEVTPADVHIKVTGCASNTCPSSCPADIDNDGFDDIVFSATKYYGAFAPDDYQGAVWAVYGDGALPSWINLDSVAADLSVYGDGGYWGSGIGSGDVNGDGFSDLVVGAARAGGVEGRAFIFYGDTLLSPVVDLLDTTADVTVHCSDTLLLGNVIAAGDFNQDEHSDILLGGGHLAAGYHVSEVHLLLGGQSLASQIHLDSAFAGIIVIAEHDTVGLGADVAMGDFNGDGCDDLLIGESAEPGSPGKYFVIFGSDGINYGDANYDKLIDLADAVFLLNYLFKLGAQPYPLLAGDTNCDEVVDVADVVYLLNYLFKSGPEPGCP